MYIKLRVMFTSEDVTSNYIFPGDQRVTLSNYQIVTIYNSSNYNLLKDFCQLAKGRSYFLG